MLQALSRAAWLDEVRELSSCCNRIVLEVDDEVEVLELERARKKLIKKDDLARIARRAGEMCSALECEKHLPSQPQAAHAKHHRALTPRNISWRGKI